MLSLIGRDPKDIVTIQENMLVIIQGANWDTYWKLANEDLKVEYIEDRIYIHSPASLNHEDIFLLIAKELKDYVDKNKLGRVIGSRFPIMTKEGKRVEPDLLFLSNNSISKGELTSTLFTGSPSLVIEIIPPGYREHDTITKRETYRKLNVEEYWIIDPEKKSLELIRFEKEKEILAEIKISGKFNSFVTELSDFQLDIDKIWEIIEKNPK